MQIRSWFAFWDFLVEAFLRPILRTKLLRAHYHREMVQFRWNLYINETITCQDSTEVGLTAIGVVIYFASIS